MPLQHFYEETIAYLLAGSIPFCFVPHREREPEKKAEQKQPEQKAEEQQPEHKPEPKAEGLGSDGEGKERCASEVLFEQPGQEGFPREELLFEQPTHSPSRAPSFVPNDASPSPSQQAPDSASIASTETLVDDAETLVNEDQTVLDEADLAFLLRPGCWEKAAWWKQRKLPRWWWKKSGQGEEEGCGGQGKVEKCGRCGGKCRRLRVGKEKTVVEICDLCGEGRVV